MNKCTEKIALLFAFFLFNVHAIAMDRPIFPAKERTSDQCAGILPQVKVLLQMKGKEDAIDFLERTNDELAERCLMIINGKGNREIEHNKIRKGLIFHREIIADSAQRSLSVEVVIMWLKKILKVSQATFTPQIRNSLENDIEKLQNLRSIIDETKSFEEVERAIVANFYIRLLSGRKVYENEVYESYYEENCCMKLVPIVCNILRNLDVALNFYYDEHYFPIPNAALSAHAYTHKNDDSDLLFKNFINDRNKISLAIERISPAVWFDDQEFNEIYEILELIVCFLGKYTSALARENNASLKNMRMEMSLLAYGDHSESFPLEPSNSVILLPVKTKKEDEAHEECQADNEQRRNKFSRPSLIKPDDDLLNSYSSRSLSHGHRYSSSSSHGENDIKQDRPKKINFEQHATEHKISSAAIAKSLKGKKRKKSKARSFWNFFYAKSGSSSGSSSPKNSQ